MLQNADYRADYTGNGSTTAFTVPFYFLDSAHLRVLKTNTSSGLVTTLILNSDYTVAGAGAQAGGTITCTVAPTSSEKLTILRNVPFTQLTHYVENDPFPAASHEAALDLLTMQNQQQEEAINRAPVLPSNIAAPGTMPAPTEGTVLGWVAGKWAWLASATASLAVNLLDTLNVSNGDALIGVKPAIAQVGVTQHRINEPIVTPEMFGAVAGEGVSNAVRTANLAALNAAWAAVYAIAGTLDISDTYEINGSWLIGSGTFNGLYPCRIASLRGKGVIRGIGTTGAVIDGTGCRFLRMSDIFIFSETAQCGLLLARTTLSGDCQSAVLENVTIEGGYSKAAIITIGAEQLSAYGCQFWNGTAGAYTYMTSPFNNQIGATTVNPLGIMPYTTMPTPTNTAIWFDGCTFFAITAGNSSNGVWIDTQFDGVFKNCIFLANPSTAGNTVIGVTMATNTINGYINKDLYAGKTVFDSCHFELQEGGGSSYMFKFVNDARSSTFHSIDIINCFNANVSSGAGTDNIAYSNKAYCVFARGTINNNSLTPYQPIKTLYLPKILNCTINSPNVPVQVDGATSVDAYYAAESSDISAYGVYWGSGLVSKNCRVTDTYIGTDVFGVSPVPAPWNISAAWNQVQPVYNGSNRRRLVATPDLYPHYYNTPKRGEIASFDTSYGYGHLPVFMSANQGDVLCHFNGVAFKPLSPLAGTPASSTTSSGIAGMVMYDSSYVYICTASGTYYATALTVGTNTWSLPAGSNILTWTNGTGNFNTLFNAVPFGFITIPGLTGPIAYQVLSNTQIMLAVPNPTTNPITQASGALAWAAPAWRRAALATW